MPGRNGVASAAVASEAYAAGQAAMADVALELIAYAVGDAAAEASCSAHFENRRFHRDA